MAYRDAAPAADDLRMVEVIDEIVQWQEYMVRLWSDGFATALAYGDMAANAEYGARYHQRTFIQARQRKAFGRPLHL